MPRKPRKPPAVAAPGRAISDVIAVDPNAPSIDLELLADLMKKGSGRYERPDTPERPPLDPEKRRRGSLYGEAVSSGFVAKRLIHKEDPNSKLSSAGPNVGQAEASQGAVDRGGGIAYAADVPIAQQIAERDRGMKRWLAGAQGTGERAPGYKVVAEPWYSSVSETVYPTEPAALLRYGQTSLTGADVIKQRSSHRYQLRLERQVRGRETSGLGGGTAQ